MRDRVAGLHGVLGRHAAALRVVVAMRRLLELHDHAEDEQREHAAHVRPPRVRDLVHPLAVVVDLLLERVEVGAGREVARKVPDARDEQLGTDKTRRDDQHRTLDLDGRDAADNAEQHRQDHEHDVRVVWVQFRSHRRVEREREQHTRRRATDEDAGAVQVDHETTERDAAEEERDPRRRRHPRLTLERGLSHACEEHTADHEAAREHRRTEELVARETHHEPDGDGTRRHDARTHLDVARRLDDVRRRLVLILMLAAGARVRSQAARGRRHRHAHEQRLQQRERQRLLPHHDAHASDLSTCCDCLRASECERSVESGNGSPRVLLLSFRSSWVRHLSRPFRRPFLLIASGFISFVFSVMWKMEHQNDSHAWGATPKVSLWAGTLHIAAPFCASKSRDETICPAIPLRLAGLHSNLLEYLGSVLHMDRFVIYLNFKLKSSQAQRWIWKSYAMRKGGWTILESINFSLALVSRSQSKSRELFVLPSVTKGVAPTVVHSFVHEYESSHLPRRSAEENSEGRAHEDLHWRLRIHKSEHHERKNHVQMQLLQKPGMSGGKIEFFSSIMDYDFDRMIEHVYAPPSCSSLNDRATSETHDAAAAMRREVDRLTVAGTSTPQQILDSVRETFNVRDNDVVIRDLSRLQAIKRIHRARAIHFGSDLHGRVEVPPLSNVRGSDLSYFQFQHVWHDKKSKSENHLD
ncbi:hypothetical protein FI667_g769, partial [Globisporangium splendens]